MRLNRGLAGLAAAACVLAAAQAPASAGFGDVLNTINRVNSNIYYLDRTINGTAYTINSLSNTLGIDAGEDEISAKDDPTGQVLQVYQIWYEEMPAADQETVSWLVMQNAQNQDVSFETISASDWFVQKTPAEQSQVASNFFKLQNIMEATAQDKSRFFGFCVLCEWRRWRKLRYLSRSDFPLRSRRGITCNAPTGTTTTTTRPALLDKLQLHSQIPSLARRQPARDQ